MSMYIKTQKLDERAKLPTRGSTAAAGYDLYALEDVEIKAGETAFIHTGLAIQIPRGYFGAIYARSGLACKHNLRPANCVGIIDSDYRGEICVVLTNDSDSVKIEYMPVPGVPQDSILKHVQPYPVENNDATFTIKAGDRIAQLVIQKFEEIYFIESQQLDESDRGEGGFGSTGSN